MDRTFERVYKRHVHDVYRYTLAVLRHEADAEDVTQATFLNAYRAFRRGERPVKARNWLIKIAHNECRQRFRAAARRPQEVALNETDGHQRVGVGDDGPTADELRHALAHLSFNQRAALVMRELEGRSYAEIAAVLETSVSAVETLLFRARRALREQLEGSLTCGQAERALTRRVEGTLTHSERGPLRAHLRECKECASLERRQRAHRSALKTTFGAVPLPVSLQSFFDDGAATVGGTTAGVAGTGVAGKVAAVVAAGAVVAGATHEAVKADAPRGDTRASIRSQSIQGSASSPALPRVLAARQARSPRAGSDHKRVKQPVGPAGKNAAHRRTLRPSEATDRPSDTQAPAAAPSPAAAVPETTRAATPPAPLQLPPLSLPKLPALPPPPPSPPPLELPTVPPPPPLPPLPQLPPPPLPPAPLP